VPDVDPECQQDLHRTNQDLAACLALPALWRGRDAHYIASTFLDVAVHTLGLDLAYAVLRRAAGGEVLLEQWSPASSLPTDVDAVKQAAAGAASDRPSSAGSVSLAWADLRVADDDGTVVIGARRKDFPTERDMTFLRAAVSQAAIALHTANDASRLRVLQAVTESALSHRTLEDLLNQLLESARIALSADTAAVLLLNDDATALVARAAKGLEEEVERSVTIPMGKGFAGRIAAERRPVFLEHVDHTNVVNPILREKGVRSLLGVPLVVNGRVLGVLHLGTLTPRRFTADDMHLLQLVADRAALAIEHSRLYEAEFHARREAERASRAKDDFLAMLSHELRNPLGSVLSAVALLDRIGVQDHPAVKARTIIRRQAQHLARLLDDLLDLARVQTGKLSLTLGRVNVGTVVERALAALRASGSLDGHDVVAEIEDAWVDGDAARIEQVFDNLVLNAVKFTPPAGTIRVRVHAVGSEVVIRVSDTGIGISAELLPRVFDLFTQGGQGLERREGGLGIGLAIVKRLVEQHGGTVEAYSDGPARGSTFVMRFPTADRPAQDPHAGESARPSNDHVQHRILVAEDNDDAREVLRALLESAGHVVYVAKTGEAAIDEAVRHRPDVAFVDIGLPGLDGYEVGRRLRVLGGTMRLVALTGYGQPDDRRRSEAAGFDTHLVKPVDETALLRALTG
jgi:signal transduction histidine kinase